jgi:hypothetical protein
MALRYLADESEAAYPLLQRFGPRLRMR